MSAVILSFPRGLQVDKSADRMAVLGQVRRLAICKGCNGAQRAIVVAAAEWWIDQRLSSVEILQRARAKADELLKPTGPEAA